MRQYRIQGSKRIAGQIAIGGAKNAVLPILAAACLNKGEVTIHNCPRIADTFLSVNILRHIGCRVEFSENTISIDTSSISEINIPDDWVNQMRSSILFMGAMLGRVGEVNIANPGGCKLGERSIDYHINGLCAMGAEISQDGEILRCKGSLKGAAIRLETPSVGATENIMLAGVLAKGKTTLSNAAKEPEIVDLAQFLKSMGADIRGAGTSLITIEGVSELTGTTHRVKPDRIVAGTYLTAAAITGGEINIASVAPRDLTIVTSYLNQMGCKITHGADNITLRGPKRLKSLPYLETSEHPGFPTDMQAQLVAALSIAQGTSVLKERIFESRYAHAHELIKMGADITLANETIDVGAQTKGITIFEINGKPRLVGTTVKGCDLRGGAALVLAGLAAEGETIVENAQYVERGYEQIEKDLSSVGADIIVEDA